MLSVPLVGCSGLLAWFSVGEHLLQSAKHLDQCRTGQGSEFPYQPLSVDSPQLIENYVPGALLKPTPNAPRIRTAARGHRRHDDCAQVGIQFVRGHDDAGTGLLNLAAERRIQTNQVNVTAADHHCQSASSKAVGVGGSNGASSPRWCIIRAFAAHPARGRDAADTTSRPGSARSSTSSGRPAASKRTFGTRMPRELPMRTIRVFVVM